MITEMQKKMGGAIVEIVAPALIMIMTGSLAFFLIELFYYGSYTGRVKWVIGLFVFATVLVSRLSIMDSVGKAIGYGFFLACATVLVLALIGNVNPLLGLLLVAVVIFVNNKLTWDCTVIDNTKDSTDRGLLERIGLDSNVDSESDEDEDEVANRDNEDQEPSEDGPEPASWTTRFFNKKKPPNTPGVWVIYLALAAFPIYGLGQGFIADELRRQNAFFDFCLYLIGSLGLLVTTAMLGLQRYLIRRKASMPNNVAITWVATGVVMIAAILIAAWILPRPYAEYSYAENPFKFEQKSWWGSSKNSVGSEGKKEGGSGGNKNEKSESRGGNSKQKGNSSQKSSQRSKADSNSKSGSQSSGKQSGGKKSQGSKSQGSKSQGSKSQGSKSQGSKSQGSKSQGSKSQGSKSQGSKSQGSKSQGSKSQSDSSKSQNGKGQNSKSESQQGKSGSKNGSQDSKSESQKSGDQNQSNENQKSESSETSKQNSKSNDSKSSESNRNRSQQQNSGGRNSGSKSSSGGKSSENDSKSEKSKGSNSSSSSSSSPSTSMSMPPVSGILWIVQVVFWIVIAIAILYFAWRYRKELYQSWLQFLEDMRNFWASLFGRKKRKKKQGQDGEREASAAIKPTVPFSAFSNPFSGGQASAMSHAQLIKYTFEALEAWGRERGVSRGEDSTPHEFAVALAELDKTIARQAKILADNYCAVAFSSQPTVDPAISQHLSNLWNSLNRQVPSTPLQPA